MGRIKEFIGDSKQRKGNGGLTILSQLRGEEGAKKKKRKMIGNLSGY